MSENNENIENNDMSEDIENSEKKESAKSAGKKPIYKKWWFWVIIVVVLAAIFGNMGGDSNDSDTVSGTDASNVSEAHIYDSSDNVEIKDVMNGTRTEKLGEYSIIRISSDEATEEALTDWYFNYVVANDYNWCMVLYTDKDDNMGVYSVNGIVEKDVFFEQDEYGDYSLGDSSQATTYYPTDDGALSAMYADEDE